jgi:hypothetical protein
VKACRAFRRKSGKGYGRPPPAFGLALLSVGCKKAHPLDIKFVYVSISISQSIFIVSLLLRTPIL